ncbi:MAG: elongation factor Ts [Piscirickettsiaceae bacterium]|nr:elongation factor Ts [Piscirickettsiaceae bacterium]
MVITAKSVKLLRDRTGAGMMECKKALVKSSGNVDSAVEAMRKSGIAKADKKLDRITSEGLIVINTSTNGKVVVMLEINSETDFVAKTDIFVDFVNQLSLRVLSSQPRDLEALMALPFNDVGDSVETIRRALVSKIGENVQVRRFVVLSVDDGVIGSYLHGDRMGAIVALTGGSNAVLAKDIAMHIVASRPQVISSTELSAEFLEKERDILATQAINSGKPKAIINEMIEGGMQKIVNNISLLGQPFVKNSDVIIEDLINEADASIKAFNFFELGDGIEITKGSFAAEVMSQARND